MSDIIIGIFTLAGTGVGAGIMFAAAARTARIEERKHLRELGVRLALARHDNCVRAAQQEADATHKVVPIPPLEVLVVDGIKLMDIVSTPGLSADEMAVQIAKYRDYSQTVLDSIQKKKCDDA